jgi:hypothetical protein
VGELDNGAFGPSDNRSGQIQGRAGRRIPPDHETLWHRDLIPDPPNFSFQPGDPVYSELPKLVGLITGCRNFGHDMVEISLDLDN